MTKIKIAALFMASALMLPVHADTLIYEGFNYGLANGTTMAGVATNATGLSGNYALTLAGGGGTGFGNFTDTGLSFGSNFKPVTGGALSMSITSNVADGTRSMQLNAALATGTQTGTVWTSYLFSVGSTGTPAGTSQTRLTSSHTASTNAHLSVLGDGTLAGRNSLLYGGETTKTGTGALSLNTTYLALATFTNLGTVGSTGTGAMWVLTEAGYNDWLVFGGGLEANLGTYAVVGSILTTSTTTTATNSAFGNSQFLSFAVSNASNTIAQTMIADELRWGSTLGDVVNVTAVPEPATYGVAMGMGALFLIMARRRKAHRP